MKRIELFILVFTLFTVMFNTSLVLLGERRFDAYIAVTILLYYVFYALIDPLAGRTGRAVQALNICLFLLFITIVVYRILEILT